MHVPPDFIRLIQSHRVSPSRNVDQVAMSTESLYFQAQRTASRTANKTLVFVGDCDLASVATAYAFLEAGINPPDITVVDFDKRVLMTVRKAFEKLGLGRALQTESQNFFQPTSSALSGRHDVFYTNPPYGKYNGGQSVMLFVLRGIEMIHRYGEGYVLIPHDPNRPWTMANVTGIRSQIAKLGGTVTLADLEEHSYKLDDDPTLKSNTLHLQTSSIWRVDHPWLFREVRQEEIPQFYGRDRGFQYPDSISLAGEYEYLEGDRIGDQSVAS